MIKYLTCLFLLAFCSYGQSQDVLKAVKSSLIKINQYYFNDKYEISYDVDFRYYAGGSKKFHSDSIKCHYSMFGNNSIVNYDNINLISVNQYSLMIYDESKELIITKRNLSINDPTSAISQIEDYVKNNEVNLSIKHINKYDQLITIVPKDSTGVDSLILSANHTSGKINSITFYYDANMNEFLGYSRKPGKVEIHICNHKVTKVNQAIMHKYTIAHYVRFEKNDVIGIGKYKSYTINNSIADSR